MSLIIKGMDMPYCCVVCPFKEMYNDGLLCKATKPHQYIPKFLHKRNEECPLIEIPTPHGRLIDADALMECRLEPNHYEELKDGYIPDYDLDSAPTIIEAEVSE